MTAEGILLFIIMIGGTVAAVGFVIELFACRAKNKAVKFILPVGALLFYLLCGLITQEFTGGPAAIFGIIAIGAAIMLLINLVFKKRNAK